MAARFDTFGQRIANICMHCMQGMAWLSDLIKLWLCNTTTICSVLTSELGKTCHYPSLFVTIISERCMVCPDNAYNAAASDADHVNCISTFTLPLQVQQQQTLLRVDQVAGGV